MTTGSFSIGSKIWPGISKLVEEAGEVLQVCGKLVGTGGDTAHWDGTDLKRRLEDELGDLTAAIAFVIAECRLDENRVTARRRQKLVMFMKWQEEQR